MKPQEQPDDETTKRLESLIGKQARHFVSVEGGYTPAARWICETTDGERCFVKVGTTPRTSAALRREFQVYENVRASFMPHALGWEDHDEAPMLILEDLSSEHWPPPWTADQIDRVITQIHEMHEFDASLEPFEQVHDFGTSHWQDVASNPEPFLSLKLASDAWLQAVLPVLIEAEQSCSTRGEAMTHFDLRSDNICLTHDRVLLVDWNHACLSNPRLDLGFWLPSLAFEGGPQPESILPNAPDVASWVAGYFAACAGLPVIPDAPRVRVVQMQQLQTALPWVARELGLPAPGLT